MLADEDIFLAGRDFSIDRGYTFVLHDNTDNLAVLSVFAGDNKIEDFQKIIDPNKANLQYLLSVTHQKMLSCYYELKGDDYHQKKMLTQRENEVLYLASIGKTYQEIAIILDIRLRTVKFHMHNVVDKFEVSNAKHAIKRAAEMRIFNR